MSVAEALRGIWRLVAVRATDDDGAEQPTMYGPSPVGTVQFDGRRLTAVLADGRPDLDPAKARTFLAFAGPYDVTDDTMTYRPDAASRPEYVGTVQPRGLRIAGNRLFLRPPSYVRDGRTLHLELEWEKVG